MLDNLNLHRRPLRDAVGTLNSWLRLLSENFSLPIIQKNAKKKNQGLGESLSDVSEISEWTL